MLTRLVVLLCQCLAVIQSASFNPEDFVNTLGGTDSRYDFSHGSTLPLVTRPWGFNSWAPQTDDDPTWSGWWFHPDDRRFFGMRVTHQPSPWISDYGNFVIKATLVKSAAKTDDSGQFAGYTPHKSNFSPYQFSTTLMPYSSEDADTKLDFTATNHGAIMRYTFPSYVSGEINAAFLQTRRVSIVLNGGSDSSAVNVASSANSVGGTITFTGHTSKNNGGVASTFAHYFAAAIFSGSDGNQPITKVMNSYADKSLVWAEFDALDATHDTLTIRVATSFISVEQAIVNLQREVGVERSFESVVAESKAEWNSVLSRAHLADVGSGYSEDQEAALYTTFYSTLYRASIFPRQISEVDSNGNTVHWSPYTGNVHAGPMTTDSGFWDAYSTVYPLHSILNRAELGTMIQGWVNSYTEGGWLPKWASPGYRGSMVGTMGDVSLADAIVKNIPGFDRDLAYEAIRKDAFEVPPRGVDGVGRVCLEAYLKYGYIPKGADTTTGGTCSEVVSRSLNYIQSDYAIAQAAKTMGKDSDSAILSLRAQNYSKIFDGDTFFFRSRDILKERFVEPFDQFAWGGDYTEAGPWQYKFYVPHDAKGLASLYKSAGSSMCDQLQKAMTMSSAVHIGGYGSQIHEMTEMVDVWGQYEHNNQPVHHMLYMFGAADEDGVTGACAAKGQYWLRKAMSTLYQPGADMFAGDEDNGQMSAWYILSSMGLYSLSPGSQEYALGSPLFARLVIDLDASVAKTAPGTGKKLLTIEAKNNSAENVYVQAVSWNGMPLAAGANSIPYTTIMEGGVLSFEMGPEPVSRAN